MVYCSLGDGATSEGEFWESLNTASMQQLPVVYLVEDNGYAISVPVEAQTPGGAISTLVDRFPHLKVLRVDGCDFLASFRAMQEAVQWARERRGPALVHASVVRPYSHSLSDDERLYKTAAERAAENERDPVRRMRELLLAEGLATESDLEQIASDVDREIADATDRALGRREAVAILGGRLGLLAGRGSRIRRASKRPSSRTASPTRWWRPSIARCATRWRTTRASSSSDRTSPTAAARITWRKSPGKGGVFKVTHGLQRKFGGARVFNSPLAEANIVGRAFGMAVRGIKPVVEIQFFDYIWPAMMQIRDEITMLRYRSGNTYSCPMVIRTPIGGYLRGGAPYHSQSGESIFAHCPGIRVVFPCTAQDAAGLLRTAIRCDDPVLFLEHKHLYRQTYNKGEYPGPNYMIPFGKGALRREGTDVVVITWGALVQRTLVAAQQAEKEGLSVAVFDLRTIIPYDWAGISALVQKTNRVIVAHEDQLTCGFGAEIAARDRRRAVPPPGRAHPARRGARLPGRLRAGSGRGDPAAVGRRAARHPRRVPVLGRAVAAGLQPRQGMVESSLTDRRRKPVGSGMDVDGSGSRRLLVRAPGSRRARSRRSSCSPPASGAGRPRRCSRRTSPSGRRDRRAARPRPARWRRCRDSSRAADPPSARLLAVGVLRGQRREETVTPRCLRLLDHSLECARTSGMPSSP